MAAPYDDELGAAAARRTPHERQALFVGLCAGVVAFCLVLVAPAFYPVKVLWYLPLAHGWELTIRSQTLGIDFFGRVLYAVVGGLAGGGLAAWIARRRRALSPGALILWTAWLATAVLLAMALFTYQLVRRHPRPLPLPAWYEPR